MRTILDAVTATQHEASDPAVSAWVSANAGSGKTHVLAQRVIRLLLDGTNPSKILCLTFTKAAAANMANRIFRTLGEWIAYDDTKLDAAIRATGAKGGGALQRAQARRLFALALETPGGLKVQTIHGFCTRLLQQFPFEANVASRFRVLEEIEQSQMLEDIRRAVLLEAAQQPDSAVGQALATIIPMVSDFAFQNALNESIRERTAIKTWLDQAGSLDAARAALSASLGLKASDTIDSIEAESVGGPHLPHHQWATAAAVCSQSSKSDQAHGTRLTAALAAAGAARVDAYVSIFLTDKDEPRKQVVTAALAKANHALAQRFADEHARVPTLCEKRRAIMTRERTMALLTVATEIIHRFTAEKDRRGRLDYDDLIARTDEMLARVESAWVHYKLDLGIDHLLIDEAQDTSPQQWDIIKRFVAEFTSGAGARGGHRRSIFAVGDDKQSIFSFQDAAPEEFAAMRQFFERKHNEAGLTFRPVKFKQSFRSVPVVLQAVDDVFKQPAAHAGLTTDPDATVHEAVRAAAPGLVELWPMVAADPKQEPDPWDAPFDTTSETSPRVKLARQIAKAVRTWIDRGDPVGDGDERHPVRAGDILVLVRQRGALFEAVIRALKTAGIAVAGADRLVLTEHIAVMDLLVLADAILLPADELAVATLLKSPLFGLTEKELFELAHGRAGSVITALRGKRPDLAARFDALREAARNVTPFAFYAELLGLGGGRKAFLQRLGSEANDAIDEFLNLALEYESREIPSLQGFVAWLRTASAEVKRDMEIARDEVRVMTVHGAKGLEAPIVVLADTTTEPAGPAQYQPRLLPLKAPNAAPGTPDRIAWLPTKRDDSPQTAAAREQVIVEAQNESRRLLYVAMTRAADRLVVCGSIGVRTMPAGCWYQLVEQGLGASGMLSEEQSDFGDGTVQRYRKTTPEIAAKAKSRQVDLPLTAPLPDWLTRNAPDEKRAAPIKPSGFVDDPAAAEILRPRDARRRALQRGNIVHRLMQSLPDIPVDRRAGAARGYIARQKTDLTDAESGEIIASVTGLLTDPQFAALFASGSRAEVPIVGRVGAQIVNGVVDRLVVAPDAILIADYKTNRPAPRSLAETQKRYQSYVVQLALYRAVLMRLYPGRPVRAALVWTDVPSLGEIPAEVLDQAVKQAFDGVTAL